MKAKRGVPENPGRGLGRRMATGALWMGALATGTRLLAVVTQVVAGWYFVQEEFAVYAASFSIASLLLPFADSSFGKLLIQRGHDYHTLARAYLRVSLSFNIALSLILVVAVALLASRTNYRGATDLVALLILGNVFVAASAIYKARLAIDLRFAAISSAGMVSAVAQSVIAITLVALNFGPIALALGYTLSRMLETLALRSASGGMGFADANALGEGWVAGLLRDLKWVLLSAIATIVILQGDYLVLSALNPDGLGIYFFAGQLSLGIVAPVTVALQSVLLPGFSSIRSDVRRLETAYGRAVRAMQLVTVPLCLSAALLASRVIDWVWQGKWNEAASLVEVMLLSTMVRCVNPIGRSVLESVGAWQMQCRILLIDAVGTCLIAALCAPLSLLAVAIGLLLWRILVNFFQVRAVSSIIGLSRNSSFALVLKAPLAGILCAVTAVVLRWRFLGGQTSAGADLLTVAAFLGAFATIGWFAFRDDIVMLWALRSGEGKQL